jgi:hypothetical protein
MRGVKGLLVVVAAVLLVGGMVGMAQAAQVKGGTSPEGVQGVPGELQ